MLLRKDLSCGDRLRLIMYALTTFVVCAKRWHRAHIHGLCFNNFGALELID